MSRGQFKTITTRLLDNGIAPKYVSRIRTELRDHYTDLIKEARESGASPQNAAGEALARLGDQARIVEEFLVRPELKSWVWRSAGVRLGLSMVALLIVPALSLSSRRQVFTRYAAAVTLGAIMTGGALLFMQFAITAYSAAEHIDSSVQMVTFDVQPLAATIEEPILAMEGNSIERLRTLTEWDDRPPLEEYRSVLFAEDQRLVIGHPAFPIVNATPVYPRLAAVEGIEGYVILEFTVTAAGRVRDVVVVESTDTIFEQPAIEAAYRLKYKPRFVEGEPVQVSGIRNTITFKLKA